MRRCAEVERGLIGVFIQLAQLGHDVEHDIRRAERNVREDKGQVALVQTDGGKQQHECHAHDGIRGGHRDVVDGQIGRLGSAAHVVDADGGNRAEHGCDGGGNDGHQQRYIQRVQNIRIAEQLDIPAGREAVPQAARLGIVERKNHQYNDRRVQKEENQQQIEVFEKLFHSSSPPSSEEPSSNLFMIHMQMKMRMVITSAIAEPRCGLYAPPMN